MIRAFMWGDSSKHFDMILAVWPIYQPLSGTWRMTEFAVRGVGNPKWRDRMIPSPSGGVKADIHRDAVEALAATSQLNAHFAASLAAAQMDEATRLSLQLKTTKALQAKERLQGEEALMLAEARRRKAHIPPPLTSELKLDKNAEPFRHVLAAALAEFPYVTGIRVGQLSDRIAMSKARDGTWSLLTNGHLKDRLALLVERSKIASGFDLNPTDHWGEVKAKIRQMLLPRANQLLQLASVRRMLDEAMARGERVLVANGIVFWYEDHGQVGWQVKMTSGGETSEGTTLWTEGTILSTNHGRLVILPFIKENGDHVKGHTKNAPKDGRSKPRHPSQYVEIPFKVLNGDLMIGLFGELPYE